MSLKGAFQHQQKILELELALARERFIHKGLKGDIVEGAFRDFLERHLPRSLSIGTGEVISLEGDDPSRTSRQLDVVISNQFQPLQAQRDTPAVFLIEGVLAAGEVKSILDRAAFSTELEKAATFRALRAKNTSRLVAVPKIESWEDYYVFYRPYFLFSFETATDWRWILVGAMDYLLRERKMPLDAIFLMDKNIVIWLSPYLKFPFSKFAGIPFSHNIQAAQKETGAIHVYKTEVILAFFIMWTSVFRATYMEDRNPIGFYLQDVVNESIADINIGEANLGSTPIETFAKQAIEMARNPLKFLHDYIKADLEGTRSGN